MAGRGLVTGGFLLCGWLVTSAGHAYAAQATAPPAPHELLAGPLMAGTDATAAGLTSAVQRPASALLAMPGLSGSAGAGAGNQERAARSTASAASQAPAAAAAEPLASAVSGLSGVITPEPGHARPLIPGLEDTAAGGLVTAAASNVPQLPQAAIGSVQATAAAVLPSGGDGPPATRQAGGRTHTAVRAGHLTALRRGRPGHLAAPAVPSARARAWRVHHRGAGATTRRHDIARGALPGGRLAAGAGTQTDPVASGAGTGTAQVAAQAPAGADGWNPAGKLVRARVSRQPADRQGVDDPAVSPD